MVDKRIAAFSLLAHINDNEVGITSFEDIFLPLVKSSLCKMNKEGVKSGKSIMEIKQQVDQIFSLDIPIPILKSLLFKISDEVKYQKDEDFLLHKDGAFQMTNFLFADYEEELDEREDEILEVEKVYKAYLTSNNIDPKIEPSIFEYIDQNRITLSRYFAYKQDQQAEISYLHQANFINFIKSNKRIYNILRRVYLGSIIAAYLEVEIGKMTNKIELLFDTNFILGLLDLNSLESTHTCRKISEICDKLGFQKSILPFTIEEIESLIERKANTIQDSFFQGHLDTESIYHAAKRRSLTKTQLQKIAKNLKKIIHTDFNIQQVGNDQKLRKQAKNQYREIYEFYKTLRHENLFSALHDTTAIVYVKERRGGKPVKGDIHKANCWFVTNTPYGLALPERNGNLPEIIRAEEILNFLWLSSPDVTAILNSSEISELGLTRLVSTTISYSLPSPKVLRDLDRNFNTYGDGNLTADDTVMVATLIAKKKIEKPEELNILAHNDSSTFISKVKGYAEEGRKEEKEIQKKLDRLLEKLDIVVRKDIENKKVQSNQPLKVSEGHSPTDQEKINLQLSNRRLKGLLIIIVLFFISFIWWTYGSNLLELGISVEFDTRLPLILGQLLLITLTLALFEVKYKTAWITTSVAILLAFFGNLFI